MSGRASRVTKLLKYATDRTSKTITRATVTPPRADDSSPSQPLKPWESKKPKSSISNTFLDLASIDTPPPVSDAKKKLFRQIRSILHHDLSKPEESNDASDLPELLEILFEAKSHTDTLVTRGEYSRERKQGWTFEASQHDRKRRLIRTCTEKLGMNTAVQVSGKLFGKDGETGIKDFNAMIEICIEKARNTDDKEVALEEFRGTYKVFGFMRECDFNIEEVTYGPCLMFIIDKGMVEEFHFFCDNIKKENPESLSRLAYYEMLLWTKVGNEDKIQMLIENALANDESNFRESYLVALGEANRQEEVLMLLETLDIKKVSSEESMERIFKSLGRFSFEYHAKKFILELKTEDKVGQDLSDLICSYVMSIPNIKVVDVVAMFKTLQDELKVASSSVPFEKLIKACCDSLEVHLAIDLVDSALEGDLTVRTSTINSILKASYVSREYNLVYRIKSLFNEHNIKPNAETIRIMKRSLVKLKDPII